MGLTLLTSLEIAFNYPDQIKIEVIKDCDKYAGFLYRLKGKEIHKLLLSTNACFETKVEAEKYFNDLCNDCVKNYSK